MAKCVVDYTCNPVLAEASERPTMMHAHHVRLPLYEELMLLALRDEKGTLESKAGMYGYALGGAILSELLLSGRVTVDPRPLQIFRSQSKRNPHGNRQPVTQ